MQLLSKMWNDENGQDMVEYALITGLISVVAFVAIQSTGTSMSSIWTNVSSSISSAAA